MKTRVLTAFAVLLCPLLAAAAEVRVTIGASGRKVICNESIDQHQRRVSGRLVPIPDARIEPLIARHADRQQLDPRLVRAVVQVESGYNARARSSKGAMGLMQLMPGTAVELAVSDPYDPDQNLRGGTTYLRRMIDRFKGQIELAVAAYDAGPEAVARHNGIPPYAETRDYVKRVLALYRGDAGDAGGAGGAGGSGLPRLGIIGPGGVKTYLTRAGNRLLLTTALDSPR
ncbi:MAG TPA: lytic transglycosylase domain-containing protein [Thermoanaerobaculia bacterium]|nr:lytic transglycosylase domain-containing protein [Thermoanaerobaculia bacterium]